MDQETRIKYAAAVRQEKFLRAAAFVVPHETLCGLRLQPLNLWHVMALDTIGSPFVGRWEKITDEDVLNFFWLLSPKYCANALARRWFYYCHVWPLVKTKDDLMRTAAQVLEYVDEAYTDSPGGGHQDRVSYYAPVAAMVDLLASQYGWTEKEIERLPLKRAFQYQKAILQRVAAQNGVFLPLGNRSDAIKHEYLNRINTN